MAATDASARRRRGPDLGGRSRRAAAPQHEQVADAIEAENPQETENVASTRSRMTELLHVPVVKRGVITPDACPAGSAKATIPVGGGH